MYTVLSVDLATHGIRLPSPLQVTHSSLYLSGEKGYLTLHTVDATEWGNTTVYKYLYMVSMTSLHSCILLEEQHPLIHSHEYTCNEHVTNSRLVCGTV